MTVHCILMICIHSLTPSADLTIIMLVSPASAAAVKKKASTGEKKKASAGEKKKAASTAAKESKKQPSNIWTKAHPKFKYGQAILIDAELLGAGPSTFALHTYYLKGCLGNKKNGIVAKYRSQHFLGYHDIGVKLALTIGCKTLLG